MEVRAACRLDGGAAGLASEQQGDAPHIILFPEIAFNKEKFLKKVQSRVRKFGYCAIVVSEAPITETDSFWPTRAARMRLVTFSSAEWHLSLPT